MELWEEEKVEFNGGLFVYVNVALLIFASIYIFLFYFIFHTQLKTKKFL